MLGDFTKAMEESMGIPVKQTEIEVLLDGKLTPAVSLSSMSEGFSVSGLGVAIGDARRPRMLMCMQEKEGDFEACRSIIEALYLRTGPESLRVLEGRAR